MKHEGVFNAEFLEVSIRTCGSSRWALFMAKLFGDRIVAEDSGYRVVAYRYQGKLYMTEFSAPDIRSDDD